LEGFWRGDILVILAASMFACGLSLKEMILEAGVLVSKGHHQLFLANL
jgi:hypothetical protein